MKKFILVDTDGSLLDSTWAFNAFEADLEFCCRGWMVGTVGQVVDSPIDRDITLGIQSLERARLKEMLRGLE